MSKPSNSDSTDVVIRTLEAVPSWFKRNKTALMLELAPEEDGEVLAGDFAVDLKQKEEAFLRERKEDKDTTTKRNVIIERLKKTEKSIRSSVKRQAKKEKNYLRILKDFQLGGISRIRSIQDGNERVRELRSSINVHKDLLDQGRSRTEEWFKRLLAIEKDLKDVADLEVQERVETTKAREERDDSRFEALDFLDDMELASEAISYVSTVALKELRELFESVDPSINTHPSKKADDQETPVS